MIQNQLLAMIATLLWSMRERKVLKWHLKLAMKITSHHLRITVKDLLAFKLILNFPCCPLVCRYVCSLLQVVYTTVLFLSRWIRFLLLSHMLNMQTLPMISTYLSVEERTYFLMKQWICLLMNCYRCLSLGVFVGSTSGAMTGLWGILVWQYTCLCCLFVCCIVCSYHFSMIVTIVMFLFAGVQILQCSAVMLLMPG